ncbi:hypothetical protein [Leptospira idonii]|uniref:Uncharacterized protein n=1 Tax=Leptospira idonii TaxID=1193500 RepID=A0A4R9M4B8_9LEPT|nr:hypothetical protein [Leptospira idonii]TGN20821.1 hypothetical protein EHS15_01930 [Leptospira idonii]
MLNDVKDKFRKGFDPEYNDYLGDVTDMETAKQRAIDTWSEALFECAKNITPASTTASSARSAFESAAEGMHLDGSIFSAAVSSFASSLGSGMVGYAAVPPAAPFVPTSSEENYEGMCGDFSDQLIDWLKTGSATLIAPPNTISNWS